MENFLWMLAVAGGPIVLGGVIAYVLLTNRRLTRREEAKRDSATREMYRTGGEQ